MKMEINLQRRKWVNNKLTTKLKSFGGFSVAVDTLAPTIKGLNIYRGKTMTSSTIRMTIKDDMSGIKSYRGEIDGKWILMEYLILKKSTNSLF